MKYKKETILFLTASIMMNLLEKWKSETIFTFVSFRNGEYITAYKKYIGILLELDFNVANI